MNIIILITGILAYFGVMYIIHVSRVVKIKMKVDGEDLSSNSNAYKFLYACALIFWPILFCSYLIGLILFFILAIFLS